MEAPQASAAMPASAGNNGDGSNNGGYQTRPHTRSYQACQPCRSRKVKCDLGDVDNPMGGPCARCRREGKACVFKPIRRKRKNGELITEEEVDEEYLSRNQRRRLRASPSPTTPPSSSVLASNSTPAPVSHSRSLPRTPSGPASNSRPLRPATAPKPSTHNIHGTDEEENERASQEAAALVQRGEIFGGHDALTLLATASAGLHPRSTSMTSNRPSVANMNTPGSYQSQQSPQAGGNLVPAPRSVPYNHSQTPTQPHSAELNGIPASHEAALEMWSNLNFVVKGWFTIEEGIRYVEYFYDHIAPLTPVAPPDFRDLSKHEALFSTEPILAYTMVTVASRYVKLEGPGANSRAYAIHSELWAQLKNLFSAILWGQDSFEDGISGPGLAPRDKKDPLHRDGLRTLGAVESLLILTEWHPRALHFPAGNYDLLISNKPLKASPNAKDGSRIDSWLKTCDRSDSMCWMLLAKAFHLAVEVGVFDKTPQDTFEAENPDIAGFEVDQYFARKKNLRNLLQVYITQTSGRLGLTGTLPELYMTEKFIGNEKESLHKRLADLALAGADKESPGSLPDLSGANLQEVIITFWGSLARIMHKGNHEMFPSRRVTRDLIATGEYIDLLKQYGPRLKLWNDMFDKCELIPPQMRHILKIEFEYARVYLNSLALQAIVQRSNKETPPMTNVHSVNGNVDSGAKDNKPIPLAVLAKSISAQDRHYIDVVVDACRNVLKVVNEDLYPNDLLKHVPVRTYFRIISVMMILLKTFTVGASVKDIELSLGLFDKAVDCLGSSVVDDIHIINSFAERATLLTQKIRSNLVRLPTVNGNSSGATPVKQHQNLRTFPVMPPPNQGGKARPPVSAAPVAPHNASPETPRSSYPVSSPFTYFTPPNHTNPYALGYTGPPTNNSPLYAMSPQQAFGANTRNGSLSTATGFAINGYDTQLDGSYETADDWYSLPLDNLFTDHHGVDINQTTFGPNVNGQDLLDVLLFDSNANFT